jgi:hypothetical protein
MAMYLLTSLRRQELPKLTERTRTHTALVKRLRSGA